MIKRKILFVAFLSMSLGALAQNNDADMERILQQRRDYNLRINDNEGFRIQIFNGLNESQARGAQSKFAAIFPELPAYLSYLPPDWKVQVGNFQEKLDAYKYIERIRREFPSALILKTKIKL